jgi:NAD(P)-dependent dehydrogenase (short-subunit alcohol dehydrogenase family)
MSKQSSTAIRYALISGAASGLGRALAVRLARDGWQLAIADIDEAGSRETLRLVEAAGGTGRIELLDVRQFDEWHRLVDRLKNDWPRLDMLINNAGVACSGQVGITPLDDWRWLIDTNLFGVINGCYACLNWLKQNPGRTSLVNISSIAAVLAPPAMATYNVAKAGVLALSETMASELHTSRVRVTVACPGFFRSRLLDCGRFQTQLERMSAERYTGTAPMNADQIADCIIRAAYRGKLHVFLPARARWLWNFRRLFPGLWIKMLGAGYAREVAKAYATVIDSK